MAALKGPRKRATGPRSVGVKLDPEAFERELAARGLEAQDLAKLTGLKRNTFTKARHGGRITRDTLMRIAVALEKVPVHPVAAALTKVSASMKTKTAREVHPGGLKKEAGIGPRRPSRKL